MKGRDVDGRQVAQQAFGTGRVTKSRRLFAEVADSLPSSFTAEELAEAVRLRDPGAGSIATAYRAVAAMSETGFLERVGTRDGSTLYTRCPHDSHHHHIVCDGCGRTTAADCPVGPAVERAAAASGFVVTRHEITLYGLCPDCAGGER